jgi:hypothetical protein
MASQKKKKKLNIFVFIFLGIVGVLTIWCVLFCLYGVPESDEDKVKRIEKVLRTNGWGEDFTDESPMSFSYIEDHYGVQEIYKIVLDEAIIEYSFSDIYKDGKIVMVFDYFKNYVDFYIYEDYLYSDDDLPKETYFYDLERNNGVGCVGTVCFQRLEKDEIKDMVLTYVDDVLYMIDSYGLTIDEFLELKS